MNKQVLAEFNPTFEQVLRRSGRTGPKKSDASKPQFRDDTLSEDAAAAYLNGGRIGGGDSQNLGDGRGDSGGLTGGFVSSGPDLLGPLNTPREAFRIPSPNIHEVPDFPCPPGLPIADQIDRGCLTLEPHLLLLEQIPTVPPFSSWETPECFENADVYSTRPDECTKMVPLNGRLPGLPALPCQLPSGAELVDIRDRFRVIWSYDDWMAAVLEIETVDLDFASLVDSLDTFSGVDSATKDTWDDLFATAIYLLIENLDLIPWTSCLYDELLGSLANGWSRYSTCITDAISEGEPLLFMPFPPGLGCQDTSDARWKVGHFLQCEDTVIRFVIDPIDMSRAFRNWRTAVSLGDLNPEADNPDALCVALNIAGTILHELSHKCGQGHSKETCGCEFIALLTRGWNAAVKERYGDCFDNCNVASSWGDADNCSPFPEVTPWVPF